MEANLGKSLEDLEKVKRAFLAKVEEMSEQGFVFRPEDGGWSAAQVMDHLLKTEEGIVVGAEKNLPTRQAVGLRERASGLLLTQMMKTRTRVKVPAGAERVLPALDLRREELLQRWRDSTVRLIRFVEGVSSEALKFGVFRHPVSGWMDTSGMLGFLAAHVQHHGYQLERIERAAGK